MLGAESLPLSLAPSLPLDVQVIQYARRLPFYLNRQLITLLTTLGVPDKRIEVLYTEMVDGLNEVMDG